MGTDDLPDQDHLGDDGQLIIPQFREVVRRQVEVFQSQHTHIHKLLGGKHHLSSGTYREGLLRSFLTGVLPKAVSVDSGFIYGFGAVESSRQLDVIIWDSLHHAPVFHTGEFVIVAPEAVVAVISVKTTLDSAQLESALENLVSVAALDFVFRGHDGRKERLPAIVKIVAAFESGVKDVGALLNTTSRFFQERIAQDLTIAKHLLHPLQEKDPFIFDDSAHREIDRVFPAGVVTLASSNVSLTRGYGPPRDPTRVVHGFRWLPYMYAQESNVTTPLEKLVYRLLEAVARHLGKEGGSLLSAWGDFHPVRQVRLGDAWELDGTTGVPLVDPLRYKGLSK
jgi:hypothetical protein